MIVFSLSAGTGKSFLLQSVANEIRRRGDFVAICATTAIAAMIYPGGRTAHSIFQIPIDEMLDVSEINLPGPVKDFLNKIKLIIWDELPMAHKENIEFVDKLLRRVRNSEEAFGGILFIGCGDWRQIAPVVINGGKQDIIDTCFKSSTLWVNFETHMLSLSIRQNEDQQYVRFLEKVATEKGQIDLQQLESIQNLNESFAYLYPDKQHLDPMLASKRTYLAPVNTMVDDFNLFVLDHVPGRLHTIKSYDSVAEEDINAANTNVEFLNSIKHSGVPSHDLKLKNGVVCVILRNLDPARGIVKGARVAVIDIARRHVVVRKLNGDGDLICLPRINFKFRPTYSSITMMRKQIPLRLAYASTLNSCQGLTLDKAVVDIRTSPFAHGQLYTALSRVRSSKDICIRKDADQDSKCMNVVYKELIN